jgi:ParB/RepB/Spo0J family partition protein
MKTKVNGAVKAAKGKLHSKGAKSAKVPKKKKGSGSRGVASPTSPLLGRVWTLEVARERCFPSPTNPRKDFKEEGLVELGDNLKRVGQLQALVVRPRPEWVANEIRRLLKLKDDRKIKGVEDLYLAGLEIVSGQAMITNDWTGNVEAALQHPKAEFEIVAGERRWRASGKKYGDLKTVRVDVRCLSDEELVEVQWVENLQREDLSPLEEAEGLVKLREQGWTVERLVERFGKSRTQIFEKLKLARATGPVREALKEGRISPSVAALVASVPDAGVQKSLLKPERNSYGGCAVFNHRGEARSVREVSEWIARECLRPILWKLDEVFVHAELVSATCRACPKMTRNMGETNPEVVKGPPRCMGLSCFEERTKAFTELREAEAKSQGLEFWDQAKFSEMQYRRDYCVEGYWADDGEKKWEKVAGDLKAHAIGEDRSGALLRVWKRSDLVAAGLVTERRDTSAATSAEMKLDEKVFRGTKARVLERLNTAMFGPGTEEDWRLAREGVLKAYYYADLLGYSEAEERKIESVTTQECFEEMAKRLCGGRWYQLSDPPDGLVELFGIDVKGIAEEVRAGLKEKAGKKRTEGGGLRTELGRDSQKGAKDAKGKKGTCRECGCTEANACPGGCSWMDETETLCSSCAEKGEMAEA